MKKFDFIDALRGFAIIGVLLSHAQRNIEVWGAMGLQATLSPWLHHLSAQGARGVQLFFVVSALTLCNSQAQRRAESHSWANFYVRRFFRIAPMFYAALVVYTFIPALRGVMAWPTAAHVIATVTFTNGWSPYWINAMDAIVPGGWSIAVEMSFYALFPLLFLTITSLQRATVLFACVLCVDLALYPILSSHSAIADPNVWRTFCFFWLPNQLPVFCLGFMVYFALERLLNPGKDADPTQPTSKAWSVPLTLSLAVLPALAVLPEDSLSALFLYAVDFAALTLFLAHCPWRLLVNKLTCHVGKISFSGYLVHFFMLDKVSRGMHATHLNRLLSADGYFFVLAGLALAGTVAVATLTYRLVEVPGQQLGKRLIKRFRTTARPAALNPAS